MLQVCNGEYMVDKKQDIELNIIFKTNAIIIKMLKNMTVYLSWMYTFVKRAYLAVTKRNQNTIMEVTYNV